MCKHPSKLAGIEFGIFCAGALLEDATVNVIIGSFTVTKMGKGQFVVTHNIGNLRYIVIATAGTSERYVHSIIYDINSIKIRMANISTSVAAESKVNFMILKA